MKTPTIYKVDLKDPDFSKIRQIALESRAGKVVVFPTETVYGVGGPLGASGLAERLVQIKGRPDQKPFAYHIGEWEMLDGLHIKQTAVFRHLARKFWPGPVTLIAEGSDGIKTGIRFPKNRIATALIQSAGEPFIATSANPSGGKSPYTADEAAQGLAGAFDILIDGGPCEYSNDSTVVDVSGAEPVIVREGAMIDEVKKEIAAVKAGEFVRKRILVVCTGNSCRSPMAEGLLLDELRKKGLDKQIEVNSCGIAARIGAKATQEAILVMKNIEVDISQHRSKPCTRDHVSQADLILAMAKEHADFIFNQMPQARPKTRVMNVVDPIGMGMLIYEAVLMDIQKKMKDLWSEIAA